MKTRGIACGIALWVGLSGAVAATTLEVDVGRPGPRISPMLYGIFFEDINYAGDGGLYAELVQNRSFEFRDPDGLFAWQKVTPPGASAEITLRTDSPVHPNNPRYARLTASGAGAGVANEGFDGIPVRAAGAPYRFSVWARAASGAPPGLRVQLEGKGGAVVGEASIHGLGTTWRQFRAEIAVRGEDAAARLVVRAEGPGTVDLDMVSLFPSDTWKGRANGMRGDLVRLLDELKPAFMRFPGGCIVEGKDLANAYRWKDTVGEVWERKGNWNRWQDALSDHKAPQYYQSYGLGFFEFFQLCEDIGAAPLPILNCGMSCQYQDKQLVPLDALEPWIQDALDLVEFANGAPSTRWGGLRAKMGHPAPFGLKYLGVGNEQWGPPYFERYERFSRALKAKHPELQLVTSAGPSADGRDFDFAWTWIREHGADLVDEHYYKAPRWFLENAGRYDGYDRRGAAVFAGEYAAHSAGWNSRNGLDAAVAEAAFMTGLERNSDIVRMASYAPLLAKAGRTQWMVDLIWFDNLRVFGTPSYHVQRMFSRNRGDVVLPVRIAGNPGLDASSRGAIGVGTYETQAEFKDLTISHGQEVLWRWDPAQGLDGGRRRGGTWDASAGVIRQTGSDKGCRVVFGDPAWRDYTFALKARKISGREGFLVLFQLADDAAECQWNIAGWGNTAHALQSPDLPFAQVAGHVDTGRWYDIRIELEGPAVRCFLDGKLVQDARRRAVPALYATASRDEKSGEIIVKAVNASSSPVTAQIDLRGLAGTIASGRAEFLTGSRPEDQNTFDHPDLIASRSSPLQAPASSFPHAFSPHSVTVLRLAPAP